MTFELRQEPARDQGPLAESDFARWRKADGEVAVTIHRIAGGFLLRFVDRADFQVLLREKLVLCHPVPDLSERSLGDLYLNQVVPMIRGHHGELLVHASAVAIEGRAAAFVGRSGHGKSTLAAAFAHAGMPFLSDDGVCLTLGADGYIAAPNRPTFRLWQDSEAAVLGEAIPDECEDVKSWLQAGEALPFQRAPLPLGELYFLGSGESEEPCISPMPARQALAELINHSFYIDVEDRERMERHLGALTRLAETVSCHTLDYPRDYARLPSVIAAVSSHMNNGRIAGEVVGQD